MNSQPPRFNKQHPDPGVQKLLEWNQIDHVFLDLDGTLLDKHFDDYFWEIYVPEIYAKTNNLGVEEARQKLLQTYKSVENTLAWTDLHYWSNQLGLDICALKRKISHRIRPLPHAIKFVEFVAKRKSVHLITNAHPETLRIKLERVSLRHWFTTMVCSQDVGAAKEEDHFWTNLENHIEFDKNATLFVDDTEAVLSAAERYGIKYLFHIAKPSTMNSVHYSATYPSIKDFRAIVAESN